MGPAPAGRLTGLAPDDAAFGSDEAPSPSSEAAFRSLYARAGPRLLAYARQVGGGAVSADDVVQEAFLRYLAADPRGLGEEQTMSYLYRITTRLVIDRWRERARELRWLGTRLDEEAAERTPSRPAAAALDPDLERAMERLKPRERALLWLAYVEGQPHAEIARALGLASPSVRVLLFRARRRLAGILREAGLAPGSP